MGDVWRRALTSKHRNATLCRVFSAKEEEAGGGSQHWSGCPEVLRVPKHHAKPRAGAQLPGAADTAVKTEPCSTQKRCAPSPKSPVPAAGGLWGFVLPFLIPRFDGFTTKPTPTARQSRGSAGASPSQQRLFQSPLPSFDLRSLGEFSLRKKQVLLNAWPGELERSQQESQKSALLGFGGLGPPAARADGFIPDPQGPQGTKSFGNTNPRVLQLPPHPQRSREHMASTRLLV